MTRKQRSELKRLLNSIAADAQDLLECVSDNETDECTLGLKAEIIFNDAREVQQVIRG